MPNGIYPYLYQIRVAECRHQSMWDEITSLWVFS